MKIAVNVESDSRATELTIPDPDEIRPRRPIPRAEITQVENWHRELHDLRGLGAKSLRSKLVSNFNAGTILCRTANGCPGSKLTSRFLNGQHRNTCCSGITMKKSSCLQIGRLCRFERVATDQGCIGANSYQTGRETAQPDCGSPSGSSDSC